ncbi:NACHT domain-containing protein [Lentzea flaviverrucosa]|uniref:NACHT domain-containing protein n=1 Tax=Lentzea flaviverrucosa TaxID=200379 RepID=UPI0014777292|nr:NACHT domain-containing protein [Lentzea flaviverrucosa]
MPTVTLLPACDRGNSQRASVGWPATEEDVITSIEIAVGRIGQALVKQLALGWFNEKKAENRRGRDLSSLIRSRFPLPRREREVLETLWQVEDEVARKLAPTCARLSHGLPQNEVIASLEAVTDTLEEADISDAALLGQDLDPIRVYHEIRRGQPLAIERAGLSSRSAALYDAALRRACIVLVHLARELPEFQAVSAVESLRRLTSISVKLDEILDRLPYRKSSSNVEQFSADYMNYISSSLDRLDLLGLSMRHRPKLALSMAYLSLSVTSIDSVSRKYRGSGRGRSDIIEDWLISSIRESASGTMQVETALAMSPRVLLRGEAGSGKTTLLDWLAVTAAQSGFKDELQAWNSHTPFPIRLRSFSDDPLPEPEEFILHAAKLLAAEQPEGWVRSQLHLGNALVLVDGVDEVPPPKRRAVRTWLQNLTTAFPKAKFIVTSRPAAADRKWLAEEGFTSVMLEQMAPGEVIVFLNRWHDAAKHARSLPCSPSDLPIAEERLRRQLAARPHLRVLATNPLLCAMLCALNLERTSELPRNRIDLYRKALDMLLHMRDSERGIASLLDTTEKTAILRDLAWRLTTGNRAEISAETMLRYIELKLPAMPNVDVSPVDLAQHLLARSGVIREPTPGRMDFVHRTFQEFLAAEEATEDHQIHTLVDNAHRDSWWETIVMACGHAKRPQLSELLSEILARAERESRYARRLRLLASACLETITEIDPRLLGRIEGEIKEHLVPPRSARETRSLGAIGQRLIRYLPTDLSELSETSAQATVRAAWQSGGSDVLRRLALYSTDPREGVQRELIDAWQYFDPQSYAVEVLSDAPLIRGFIHVRQLRLVPFLSELQRLSRSSIDSGEVVDNVNFLEGVPHLWAVSAQVSKSLDLRPLAEHSEVRQIGFYSASGFTSTQALGKLTDLDSATLFRKKSSPWRSLKILENLTPLHNLTLDFVHRISDFSFLSSLAHLTNLSLYELSLPRGFGEFVHLDQLQNLYVGWTKSISLSGIADALPSLKVLSLVSVSRVDLEPLTRLGSLTELKIAKCAEPWDLSPLAGLKIKLRLDKSFSHDGIENLGEGIEIEGVEM